jgi:hypothetical protein
METLNKYGQRIISRYHIALIYFYLLTGVVLTVKTCIC